MTRAQRPDSWRFDRAVQEGERRLDQSLLELVSTSFIVGFTIVFGLIALGIVEAIVASQFGNVAKLAGALAFGVGLIFVVVGRTELFNENFLVPAAAAVDRSDSWLLWPLVRLWVVTLVFNLLGGGLFALVFSIEGALPPRNGGNIVRSRRGERQLPDDGIVRKSHRRRRAREPVVLSFGRC